MYTQTPSMCCKKSHEIGVCVHTFILHESFEVPSLVRTFQMCVHESSHTHIWNIYNFVSFPINAPSALERLNTSRVCSVHSYVPATTKSLILLTTWTKKIYWAVSKDLGPPLHPNLKPFFALWMMMIYIRELGYVPIQ